jgi:hypothetical protein
MLGGFTKANDLWGGIRGRLVSGTCIDKQSAAVFSSLSGNSNVRSTLTAVS